MITSPTPLLARLPNLLARLPSKLRYGLELLSSTGLPKHQSIAIHPAQARAYLLRCAARRATLRRWPRIARPIATVGMTLLWPLASCKYALQCSMALPESAVGKKSRAAWAWWAWKTALTRNIAPVEALSFRLFECEPADFDRYFYLWDLSSLGRQLTSTSAQRLAQDKAIFADWCLGLDLRAIPTLAIATSENGSIFAPDRLPAHDVLLKPRRGAQGVGIEAWRWRDDTFHHGERQYSRQQLAEYMSQRAAIEGDLILQELIIPHASLQAIAGDGMPALRILTARFPDDRIKIGPAMLQAPEPGATISQSGPFRLVDSATGKVLPPTLRQSNPMFEMPLGSGFDGIRLPHWESMLAMLRKAHSHFPGQAPLIGWDVLFDQKGPVICEANTSLSLFMFQSASAESTVASPVGEVLEAWL